MRSLHFSDRCKDGNNVVLEVHLTECAGVTQAVEDGRREAVPIRY